MEINVCGRHFNITEADRQRTEAAINAEFADLPLKITSVQAVIDMQDPKRFKASVVVNIKNHTVAAEVEDMDFFKAVDGAIAKTSVQAKKLIDKRKTGKQGERLADVEPSPDAENK